MRGGDPQGAGHPPAVHPHPLQPPGGPRRRAVGPPPRFTPPPPPHTHRYTRTPQPSVLQALSRQLLQLQQEHAQRHVTYADGKRGCQAWAALRVIPKPRESIGGDLLADTACSMWSTYLMSRACSFPRFIPRELSFGNFSLLIYSTSLNFRRSALHGAVTLSAHIFCSLPR